MKLLLVLPLFIFSILSSKSLETEQIEAYSKILNNQVIPSEYLWSSSILFHSIGDREKTVFLNRIENQVIKDIFESSGSRTSLIELSFQFGDEYLLLAYLLNQPDKNARQVAYSKFYSNQTSEKFIQNLNKKVVDDETISYEDHNLTNHPFAVFLLNHYYSAVTVVNKKYFESVLNEFDLISKNNSLIRDLLISAKFNSYYLLDRYSEISKQYRNFTDLKDFPISFDLRDHYWSLDYVMYQTGNIDKSLEIQRNFTIPITEYLQDGASLNSIYSSHGGNLYTLGKYQEAREVFQQVLEWSDDLNDQNLTRLYNNLSLVYFKTGE